MTDRCEIHGQESVFCYLENRNCDDGRNRPPLPDRTPAHGARREGEPARHATSLGVSGGEIAAAETAPYISGSGKAAAANPSHPVFGGHVAVSKGARWYCHCGATFDNPCEALRADGHRP